MGVKKKLFDNVMFVDFGIDVDQVGFVGVCMVVFGIGIFFVCVGGVWVEDEVGVVQVIVDFFVERQLV